MKLSNIDLSSLFRQKEAARGRRRLQGYPGERAHPDPRLNCGVPQCKTLIRLRMQDIASKEITHDLRRFQKKCAMFLQAQSIEPFARFSQLDHKSQTSLVKPHRFRPPD